MINPFQAQCVCGYVFRGTSTSTAVSDLARELQDIDSKSGGNPYNSQLNGGIDIFEQQKIALITNFTIPNLKEELVEFALLTRAHLAKIYADKKRPKNDELYNAWKTKFEESYLKAKMMLTSSDLALFKSTENEINDYEKRRKRKRLAKIILWITSIFVCAIIVVTCLCVNFFIPIEMGEITIPNSKIVQELPEIDFSYGKIVKDKETVFSAYFGNITKEEFKSYIEQCVAEGFTENRNKKETSFYAEKNEKFLMFGKIYVLKLTYDQKNCTMFLKIREKIE